jgi:hypothetical protein
MQEKKVKPESEGDINSEPDRFTDEDEDKDGYERQRESGGKVYDDEDTDGDGGDDE